MSEWDRQEQGRKYEGYAFTFCKAAFLVLIFQKYALFALSGLATLFYVLAALKGVKTWRCWAKPPWVTLFWLLVFAWQGWVLFRPAHLPGGLSFSLASRSAFRLLSALMVAPGYAAERPDRLNAPIAKELRGAANTLPGAATVQEGKAQDTTAAGQLPEGSAPAKEPNHAGTVLVAGGGKTSPALVKTFVEAAGGPDAPIVILPQTEADPAVGGPESVALFRDNGARQVDAPVGLSPDDLCRRLREARGVWIPGGDQNRFMTAFPETSGVPEAIRQVLRRGGVVGGTSAGASLMGAKMPTGETVKTQGLQSGGCPLASGLNLLPKTIVDQHFFARNRMQRLLTAVLDQPGYTGLGVEEGGWVVARRGAYVAQSRQALVVKVPAGVRRQQGYFGADKIEMRLLLPDKQIITSD